jgi:hypothetical protein
MRDEQNALLALKNAWNGAVTASEGVRALAQSVAELPDTLPLEKLDLETYERLTLAQANAVMALRGLLEDLARQSKANAALGQ